MAGRKSAPRTTLAAALLATFASAAALAAADWPQFNFDARHGGWNPLEVAIRAENVATLHLLYSVHLPAVADGAPAYLAGAATPAGRRDLAFVTTKDGRLVALDAATGAIRWSRQPAAGPRYTTSSPALDPDRLHVYSYGLEGRVHKYAVADGAEVTGGGWPQLATRKPLVEKGSSALTVATAGGRSYLYVAHGGYPGDAGDYQGHVTAIDLASGAQRVWNAACSDAAVHFTTGGPPDCPHVQTAVWARQGVVHDAALGRILFATGNGDFDAAGGGRDWGDSVLALAPDGRGGAGGLPADSYTPAEYQRLDETDADLGSTAPAILPAPAGSRLAHLGVQGGKDGLLRLLDLADLSGQGGPGHVGGELQKLPVPQGGPVLTAPAVWVDPGGATWAFVSNGSGISGLRLAVGADGTPRLVPVWTDRTGGSSPIVAGGTGGTGAVLFQATFSGVRALAPATGAQLWSDGAPRGLHWESPIAVDGRLLLADEAGDLLAYAPAAPPPCVPDAATLCLGAGGRFALRALWRTPDGAEGTAHAVPLTADTGYLWFFDPANVEAVVKVLDGCPVDASYWVFAGGLTDVLAALTVTDGRTGVARTYVNPLSTPFRPLQDSRAFPSCP
jgi:outer membrane protein assembly factor BamB